MRMNAATHPVEPEQLMVFIDGELSADEARQVSAHIAACVDCAGLVAELHATSNAVAEWRVANVPRSVEETVAGYVTRTNLGLKVTPRKGSHRLWTWKRWVAFGGATTMLAVIALAISLSTARKASMELTPADVALQSLPEMRRQAVDSLTSDGQPTRDARERLLTNFGANEFSTPAPAPPADSNGSLQQGGVIGGNPDQVQAQQSAEAPMIARTASLRIVVKDFEAARANLDAFLARHHGYAAQMNVNTPEGSARSLQASLRVPAPMLAAAVADLKTLGHVETESQSGEEVTRQHEDLLERLKTSRETEDRFRAILNQRTGTVSDVLRVEQGIAEVRGEIEQMEAEQKSLEHRVDFATIELQLSEEYKAELNGPESAGTRMHNALVAGFQNVGGSLFALLLFLEEYGPVLLLWSAILGAPVLFMRRRYKKSLAAVQ
jgi:anti-sigma factor RsiW